MPDLLAAVRGCTFDDFLFAPRFSVLERRDHCVFDRRQPCPLGHLGRDTEAYLVEAPREMGRNAMALRDGNFGVRHGSMMARVRLISK